MRKSVGFIIGVALLATPAIAQMATPAIEQIRPDACVPVFPLMDKVAAVSVPQDVTLAQAAPTAAAKKAFFGLPFLPFLLAGAGAGGIAALSSGGGDSSTVSPA